MAWVAADVVRRRGFDREAAPRSPRGEPKRLRVGAYLAGIGEHQRWRQFAWRLAER